MSQARSNRAWVVGALLSLCSVSTAWANPGIRLQGQVTTPSGTPIDGLVGVTVRVYAVPTGGTPLYAETFSQMVTNGALDLIVGAGQGISENDLVTAMSPQPSEVALVRYLALQMDGDTAELSPRRRVTGGAFAAYASNAATLGGQPPAAFATTSSLQNFVTSQQVAQTLTTYVQASPAAPAPVTFSAAAPVTFAQPQGSSPFAVQSTTVVQNLNADRVDGISGENLARLDVDNLYTRAQTFEGAATFEGVTTFAAATGTAPFMVSSTTLVTNLNADRLDGLTSSQLARLDADNLFARDNTFEGQSVFEGASRFQGAVTFQSAPQFTTAQGSAPFSVTSTTQVSNLNAALLNGQSAAQLISTAQACTSCSSATTLGGQAAAFYTNASNLNAGLLAPARGGVGLDTSAAAKGTVLFTSATGTWSALAPGATGQVLKMQGSGAPAWDTDLTGAGGGGGTVTNVSSGTGLTGGPITGSGTLSIDPAIVPNLGAGSNTFTGSLTASGFSGSGASLTALNATQLTSGSVPDARLSSNVELVGSAQTITGVKTFADGMLAMRASSGSFSSTLHALATAARDITFPDVTGTVLTTGNLSAITATGTIASGTWNGTAISAARGGVALDTSAAAKGTTLYTSAVGAWAALPPGSTGQVLKMQAGGAPAWDTDLAGGGGGTVTSVGSGTGLTGGPITTTGTLAIDTSVVATTTNALTFSVSPKTFLDTMLVLRNSGNTFSTTLSAGATTANRTITLPDAPGTVITTGNLSAITTTGVVSSGTWQGGVIDAQRGGTGLNTSATPTGSVLYTSGAGAWATLPAGSDGEVLKLAGGVPTWSADNDSGGTVTSITAGTGLTGGVITGSGTIALNTASVPLLSFANAFTGSNTFSGSTQTFQAASGSASPMMSVRSPASGQTGALLEVQNSANVVTTTVASSGVMALTSAAAGNVPLTIAGAAGQTSNLVELKNSSNTTLLSVNSAGNLSAPFGVTIPSGATLSVPSGGVLSVAGITNLTAGATISGGALSINNGATLASGQTLTMNGATLSGTITASGATLSSATLSAGTLSGSFTGTGATINSATLSGGTLASTTSNSGTITGGSYTNGTFSGDGSGLTGVGLFEGRVPERGCTLFATGSSSSVYCRTSSSTTFTLCGNVNSSSCGSDPRCTPFCLAAPQDTIPTTLTVSLATGLRIPGSGTFQSAPGVQLLMCKINAAIQANLTLQAFDVTGNKPTILAQGAANNVVAAGPSFIQYINQPLLSGEASVGFIDPMSVQVSATLETTTDRSALCWIGGTDAVDPRLAAPSIRNRLQLRYTTAASGF